MKLKEEIAKINFKEIPGSINNLNFSSAELNTLLCEAVEALDWLTVAKGIQILQLKPDSIYVPILCKLIKYHSIDIHPELVIDVLSDVVEGDIDDKSLNAVVDSLGSILFTSFDGDPAFNINIKCIENLDWIVRLRNNSSGEALNFLKEASNSENQIISEEAKECIQDLVEEGVID